MGGVNREGVVGVQPREVEEQRFQMKGACLLARIVNDNVM